MRRALGLILLQWICAATVAAAPPRTGRRAAKAPPDAAGAVYLFQRAPRRLPALVDLRRDYLSRIVRPILARDVDPEPASP